MEVSTQAALALLRRLLAEHGGNQCCAGAMRAVHVDALRVLLEGAHSTQRRCGAGVADYHEATRARGVVPAALTVSVAPTCQYAKGWNDCRAAMLSAESNNHCALPEPDHQDQGAQRYTCIGKGGEYVLLGRALPAGELREALSGASCGLLVYRNEDAVYVRSQEDFERRMAPISP